MIQNRRLKPNRLLPKRFLHAQKGSALIGVLAVILIGTLLIVETSTVLNPIRRFFGARSKDARNLTVAEKGLEMAMGDLLARAENRDWTTVQFGENAKMQDRIDVGLVVDPQMQRRIKPRFQELKNNKAVSEVYYFPSPENGDPEGGVLFYDDVYPKFFHIIAKSIDPGTGAVQTEEAMLEVDVHTTADFALAFLENFQNPGLHTVDDGSTGTPSYSLVPMDIIGRTHLGKIHPSHLYFNRSYWHPDILDPPASQHILQGLTTIDMTTGDPTASTFPRDPAASIDITEYEDEYNLNLVFSDWTDTQAWINLLTENPTINLGTGQVCLQFSGLSVERYVCDTSTLDPNLRYKGSPKESWSLAEEPLYLWCDCQLHVRGRINGVLGVMSTQNIIIEGDIQYVDQSLNSLDYFSAFSQDAFIIPATVPNFQYRYFDSTPGGVSSPTNEIIANDRDAGVASYINPDNPGDPGAENAMGTLDLDGAYFSLDTIRVEPNIESPGAIQSMNGNFYEQYNTGAPDYYYVYDATGGQWQHKEDPAVCATPGVSSADCGHGDELRRNYSAAIWIYGSLALERPPILQNQGMGFNKLAILWDERFDTYAPFGAANLNKPKLKLMWRKRINGDSPFLAENL